ncbi:hypothetical protein ACFSL6_21575 [Paenibacillus thailandensis]|uniref:Uncharacterized protein n=1 Tax=Paenibacillus thailandensis TaxID=393250 RepID=A0ABW5R2D7_9BACL
MLYRNNSPRSRIGYVFVAIDLSKVREAVVIDYVGSTTCYWAIRKALLPEPVAFLGSIAGPMAIRLALHLWRERANARLQRKRKLIAPQTEKNAPTLRPPSAASAGRIYIN